MAERVLVIAPHPDDEAIGCGGTIGLHRRRGDPVHVVFLTSGERGMTGLSDQAARSIREAEAEEAGRILGVGRIDFLRLPDLGLDRQIQPGSRQLRAILEAHPSDFIYLPHPEESHPDHEATLPIVREVLARLTDRSALPELRAYEVWSPMTRFDWVEDISQTMRQKLLAVRRYKSQLAVFRYDHAVRGLNRYRGILAGGSSYAEAFRYCPSTGI